MNDFWRARWLGAHYESLANDLNLIEVFRLCCKLYLKAELRIRMANDIEFSREFDRAEKKILFAIHDKLVDLYNHGVNFTAIYTSEDVIKWCWGLL